jgi:hypothetical protein
MSIEAIAWALNEAPIPANRRDASSLAIVLVGLANHADPYGHNAFPAVATLVRYTRLSPRAVQYALRGLAGLGLITPSDPEIVAAHLKRADRRPNGWNLAIHSTIHRVVHNHGDGAQPVHAEAGNGVQTGPDGVQTTTSRGARTAPEPSLNRPRNHPARHRRALPVAEQPVDAVGHRPIGPPCGQCDARDTDPVTARVIWLDADHTESARCSRCHPRADIRPTTRNRTMTHTHSQPPRRGQSPEPDSREKTRPSTACSGQNRSRHRAIAPDSGGMLGSTTTREVCR